MVEAVIARGEKLNLLMKIKILQINADKSKNA